MFYNIASEWRCSNVHSYELLWVEYEDNSELYNYASLQWS